MKTESEIREMYDMFKDEIQCNCDKNICPLTNNFTETEKLQKAFDILKWFLSDEK